MDERTLSNMIERGESETVEFKREMERAERLAKECVALANRQGGTILIGVDDDKTVYGVNLRPNYETWMTDVGAQRIDPPLPLSCETSILEGNTVLILHVPRGPHKPHCVREGEHKCTVYIRHGSTSRPASREEIGTLWQESGVVDFDRSPVPGATLQDLNMQLIEEYASAKLGVSLHDLPIDSTQQLQNWKILLEQAGEQNVSFTGLLFFGRQPGDFLPQACLWLKRFKGITTEAWHPGKELNGPLPQAIQETMDFIKSYTVVEEIRGLERIQKSEYLEEVVREALVNAIAHRNYVRRGSRIHVSLFDDRIEIRNPGPLPNGVTLESIRYGVQATRNPTITRYLRAYGYWEGDGLGIPRMLKLCRTHHIKEPDFALFGDDLVVTLYSRRYEEFHTEDTSA